MDAVKTVLVVLGVIALVIVWFVVSTVISIWLWANCLGPVTGFQTPTFLQMLGIEILCALLVAPGARHGGHRDETILSEIRELRNTVTGANRAATPAILY